MLRKISVIFMACLTLINRMPQPLPDQKSDGNSDAAAPSTSRSVYRLLFVYEDWSAREKARRLRNNLARNCPEHVLLKAKFYSFADLCHPELIEAAKKDVNESDMFVVSSSGAGNLPMFVKNWLDEFNPSKTPMACVEFFEPGISEPFVDHCIEHWSAHLLKTS